ncbi:SH3 domain-containing protein [Hyalangium gracile]|uniref:SH3 domain-containing protein n=1 Tax=Hyalangium gracile TaxID=394092 RepID=UPI001CCA346F|nr:SH3 domain-containing protein [Hyalangium gracile]
MSLKSVSYKPPVRPSAPPSAPAAPAASAPPTSAASPASTFTATRFEPPARRPMSPDGTSSTLRNEVLGDGKANCLEKASNLARPNDTVVLFRDANDPVGHAVVQRPDGSVVDPNNPSITYPDLGSWQASHPEYNSPAKVPASALKQVLSLPPGPKRDAAISALGLSGVANRQVADGPLPSGVRVDASDGLRLREGAGTNTKEQRMLTNGTELTVLGSHETQTDWLFVQTSDGLTGYVHQGYVQPTDGQSYPGIGDLGDSRQAQGGGTVGGSTPPPSGPAGGFQSGSVGVSPSVTLGTVTEGRTQENLDARTPHFSQGDPLYSASTIPAWGGTASIKDAGCLITCKAMAISAYQNGDGQPMVSPGDLADTSNSAAVTVGDRTFVQHSPAFGQGAIDRALEQGLPVAVRLDGPYGEHWVLITGKNTDGTYTARDPGFRANAGTNDSCQDISLTWNGTTLTGQAPFGKGAYTANTSVNMHIYAPEGAYTP